MADIRGKTKKKPPPKSEGKKKPAAAPARASVKPAPSAKAKPARVKDAAMPKAAVAKPVAAAKPPALPKAAATAKAAAAKPSAIPKAATATPEPAPLASMVVFPTVAKTHVAPKPLAVGAFVLDKLAQVSLTATNLDLAVEFYRDVLGLKFIARLDPPGIAFFQLGGGVRLMLSATASQATLYFAVDSLDTAMRELKARGLSFLQPPTRFQRDDTGQFGKKGIEEWMTLFRDPSGNLVGLVERRSV